MKGGRLSSGIIIISLSNDFLSFSRASPLFFREGYPVLVHQRYKLNNSTGHNRVVIGYSDKKACFIVNDPSPLGPAYEIPYDVFVRLWSGMKGLDNRPLPWRNQAYLVIPGSKK